MTGEPRGSGDRVYRLLLRLYPAEFREQYGRAMMDFHRDRVAMARRRGDSMAALWLRTSADMLASALAERLRALVPGAIAREQIAQDAAYAARGLGRRPAFAAIVISTIALGVGANAAIFSVVNGVLLRPLIYPHADRLVSFGHEPPHWLTSDPDFLDYHREMKTLDGLAAYTRREATLVASPASDPERVRLVRASEDFFPVLGVAPVVGRTFVGDEYVPKIAQVVVLSHSLWQREFGGDPRIVGRKISIEGAPRTIVGVMPQFFDFPEARTDIWMPLPRFNPDSLSDRANHYLFMVTRLKPGVSVERARGEASTIAQRIMRDNPRNFDPQRPIVPRLTSVRDDLVGGTRPYLFALLGAVGFVLLIACANVANLMLVRGESRQREMAVRSALGASERRLLAQLLVEASVLAVIGGALGLGVAWAGDRALVSLAPASIPRLDAIGIDWRVLAFTGVVSIATGVAIGLLPAWRAARGNAIDALKDGGRGVVNRHVGRGVRGMLVVAEVALAVVTLSGAGMLLRSLWHLQSYDLGFDPRATLTAKVALSAREYTDERSTIFFDQVIGRLRAIPGVREAAAAKWLPVVDAGGLWGVAQEGKPESAQWALAVPQNVTPGYFGAMGIPIIAGHDFTDADRVGAPFVGVVSKAFAAKLWPGENALGKRFKLGGPTPLITVIGIVGDFRSRSFADTPEPTMYFPYAQSAKSAYVAPLAMAIVVRVDGDPMALAQRLRDVVRSIDRTIPVSEVRTLESIVGTSVSTRRFNTALLAGFALLALLLAGIGTYGVISYGVSQRSHEIGVRMALGAEDRSVLLLVMAEGAKLCGVGLAAGLIASAGVGRAIRALLVDVTPIDGPTLAVTALVLGVVATIASALPARRALAVNPSETLRE
jgi:putative ABC transport system permease protein